MKLKDPYQIIKRRHFTEKSVVLQQLQNAESNPSVSRCKWPKYVFVVHNDATKRDIANAIEVIYKEKEIKVVGVNTINVKAKATRRRGRIGSKSGFKKAVVTLDKGHTLDEV